VKPGQLVAVTTLYTDKVVPLIEQQHGFHGLLVLRNSETDQEVSISLWDTKGDMDDFAIHHVPQLMKEFLPYLTAAPAVAVHQVCCQAEAHPVMSHVQFSERSLGLHIEEPLEGYLNIATDNPKDRHIPHIPGEH
jgi:hypothetical protein